MNIEHGKTKGEIFILTIDNYRNFAIIRTGGKHYD